jgi:cell division protein FtsB
MSDSGKQVRLGTSFSRPDTSARANLPSDVSLDWFRPEFLLPLALMGSALGSVPVQIFSDTGLPQLRHLEEEKAKTTEQESRLSQEIAEIRAEVERIKADPAAVEQVARDELGMVRQTEVVFQFGR